MTNKKTVDMTTGSPFKHILGFMIPTLVGFLFQQFYSVADTVIIGRNLGEDSLAAVGATGCLNFMIIGFCIGVCTGFAIPIAQKFGAKDYSGMRRFVANSIWAASIIAVIMTTVVCILCMSILRGLNTPSNIINESYTYIWIIFLGIPVTIMYNLAAGIMRSLGDSKTPVYFLLLSSVINIGLDIIMIKPLGIAGPAWATVISQLISGLLCILYIRKKYEILKFEKGERKPMNKYIGRLIYMGIPMGLQYSITAIGSVILQSAVNVLGSTYVASSATAMKVSLFFVCPFDALGSTAATYGGQNMGARKYDRISAGLKWAVVIGFVYALIALAIIVLYGKNFVTLFIDNPSELLLENAEMYLKANATCYFFLALVNTVRFLIQGMGYSVLAILAGVFEMVARGFAGFYLVPKYGYIAACLASPLAWIMADVFLITAYKLIMRRLRGQEISRQEIKTRRPVKVGECS